MAFWPFSGRGEVLCAKKTSRRRRGALLLGEPHARGYKNPNGDDFSPARTPALFGSNHRHAGPHASFRRRAGPYGQMFRARPRPNASRSRKAASSAVTKATLDLALVGQCQERRRLCRGRGSAAIMAAKKTHDLIPLLPSAGLGHLEGFLVDLEPGSRLAWNKGPARPPRCWGRPASKWRH